MNALTPVQETVKKTIGNVTIVASLLTKHATINACQNLCTDVGTVAFFKTKHATEPVLASLKSTVMVVVLTIEIIMYGSVKAAVYLKMSVAMVKCLTIIANLISVRIQIIVFLQQTSVTDTYIALTDAMSHFALKKSPNSTIRFLENVNLGMENRTSTVVCRNAFPMPSGVQSIRFQQAYLARLTLSVRNCCKLSTMNNSAKTIRFGTTALVQSARDALVIILDSVRSEKECMILIDLIT
jgi:hypothetical protein